MHRKILFTLSLSAMLLGGALQLMAGPTHFCYFRWNRDMDYCETLSPAEQPACFEAADQDLELCLSII